MGWLQIVLALVQLAPSIVKLVMDVEGIITGAKTGSAKKSVVMQTVASAPNEVQGAVSNLVDKTVEVLNSTGVFKKVA